MVMHEWFSQVLFLYTFDDLLSDLIACSD